MADKRVVVTGGAGFIGSSFLHHMIDKHPNYDFVNLDALTYSGNIDNIWDLREAKNYEFVKGDICDDSLLETIIREGDTIINFAAESHVDNSITGPKIFTQTNVLGTHALLEVARRKKAGLFLQISTDEVYGSLNFDSPSSTEKDRADLPSSPYSSTKAAAELLCHSYVHTFNQPIIITRSSNNFGPRQYPEKMMPLFITNLLEGKQVPLYGDGKNVRDWLYVQDNCEALDFVMHNGKAGEAYNIGGGNEVSNLKITKMILSKMGFGEEMIKPVEDRKGHDLRYSLDCSKVHSLGWKPRFPFEESVGWTIEWYKSNRSWWEKLKPASKK